MTDITAIREHLKSEIKNIPNGSYNAEQKQIACDILDSANETNIEQIYTFITQRVKLGFTFDVAPEVNHNCISLIKYNEKLSFGNELGNTHKLIIGENYDALKNLLATYTIDGHGLIDVIYIDPPYNTESARGDGNDYKDAVVASKFIYRDKFTRNGWLNMMRERLIMARKLLSDTGVIFISIDDNEQAYLKVLCDEIFGEDNFYGELIQLKGNTQNDSKTIQKNHEYILCYCKKQQPLLLTYDNDVKQPILEDNFYLGRDTGASSGHDKLLERPNLGYTIYFYEGTENGATGNHNKLLERPNQKYPGFKIFTNGDKVIHAIAIADYDVSKIQENSTESDVYTDDTELLELGYKKIRPPKRKGGKLGRWTWSLSSFKALWNNNEVYIKNNTNVIKKEFVDVSSIKDINGKKYYIKTNCLPIQSIIKITNSTGTSILSSDSGIIPGCTFSNPKSPDLIKYLIGAYKKSDITILDFFAGSGTTGQAVMELNQADGGNRKCILVSNNENNIAINITRERLYRVVMGVGSNGESFEWKYSPDKPYLNNNKWDVFDLETTELRIDDFEKADKLLKQAHVQFKLLNPEYESKSLNIYNQLASLNPYKK